MRDIPYSTITPLPRSEIVDLFALISFFGTLFLSLSLSLTNAPINHLCTNRVRVRVRVRVKV
jgi:hypothetical protein